MTLSCGSPRLCDCVQRLRPLFEPSADWGPAASAGFADSTSSKRRAEPAAIADAPLLSSAKNDKAKPTLAIETTV